MFKQKHLSFALAAAITASSAHAFNADSFTISGYVKNETAALTQDGTFNGQETSPSDTTKYNDSGDLIKSESSVKLFVNGDVGEGSSMHAELLLHNDSKAVGSHYKNNDPYTQSEFLRELYVDTKAGDWDVRLGKQQVVWGTADGAKLLDIINPTDYREMAQNTMAESRVPTWMVNAEKYLDNGANIQIIASQPRENVFAGLNRDISSATREYTAQTATGQAFYPTTGGTSTALTSFARSGNNPGQDQGNPFILKGVDTITGQRNGFLNIVPDLGNVATQFWADFGGGGGGDAVLKTNAGALATTVSAFAGMTSSQVNGFGTYLLTAYAAQNYTGDNVLAGFGGAYDSNLYDATGGYSESGSSQDSVFEYMGGTKFATFDAFVNAKSEWVRDMPDDLDADLSARYRHSTDNGLNYSLAYSYAYEKNPVIDISWRGTSGELCDTAINSSNNVVSVSCNGTAYGGAGAAAGSGDEYLTLRFTETMKRAHNLGAAFDFTVDSENMGAVVLRSEFLYTKDAYYPVFDLGHMYIGDLTGALKMEKADRFKYVLGADVTVMTDLFVSGQFIQERNLDYVDEASSYGSKRKYTADFASMHLTNGFKKAEKNKEFYSIFLSKPFGSSGEGRWNNILMLEEGGGRWNRFDVEYSLSNDLIGTVEYNKYWGDDNTQFGQLEAATNIQVGLKYLFE